MRNNVRNAFVLAALLLSAQAQADVRLPALFADHAVLQRDIEAPVWGWADEGEEVTVSIDGKSASAVAKGGKWRVKLPALKAGGPYEMTVRGKNEIVLKDLMVGEVWVCGGQSNMQWTLARTEKGQEAIASSDNKNLRLFTVKIAGADAPAEDVVGQWALSNPQTSENFSAVGYYFGRALQRDLGVPVGLVQSCLGGTNAYSWMNRETLEGDPDYQSILKWYESAVENYPQALKKHEERVAEWKERVAKAKKEGRKLSYRERRKPPEPMGPRHVKRPSALYYAMIRPLQPYGIRGAIWYQGESNSGSAKTGLQYRKMFADMIGDWRRDWGQGDFPFLFVQLAAYGGRKGNGWQLVQEAQAMTVDNVPNTAMAVSMDLGDEKDIHPQRKTQVGERLALAARKVAYGQNDLVYSGPIYRNMTVQKGRAVLTFDHTGSGLEARGGALKEFEIAGEDGKFVAAQAQIQGDKVAVWADGLDKPAYVRYAWKPYNEGNLYNKEGLPASPFRTDDLPLE